MMGGEPLLYQLDMDVGGCRFDVRWNDVPVLRRAEPRTVTVDLPLNPWVVTGENVLSVEVRPPADDAAGYHRTARCEALVFARPLRDRTAARVPLGGVVFRGRDAAAGTGFESSPGAPDEPPVRVEGARGGGTRGSRILRLDTPFPPWRWRNARSIQASPVVRTELERAYARLWEALARKDVAAVRRILAPKAVELATAYHAGGEEEGHELLRVLEVMDDADYELQPLAFDGMALDVFGDGRLARIVDPEENGPLRLVHRDEHVGCVIEVTWCLDTGGWTAIR